MKFKFKNYYLYNVFIIILFFNKYIFSVAGSNGNASGITYFNEIPEFLAGSPIRLDLMPSIFTQPIDIENNFGISACFSYSTESNDYKTSQFFSPNGNINLFVAGGPDYFSNEADLSSGFRKKRDIDAAVLGITDDQFQSLISLLPSSSVSYIGLFGYYTILRNEEGAPRFSLQCAFPLIDLTHKVEGYESVKRIGIDYEKSPIKSALSGLSSDSIKYQRWNFSEKGMNKKGIGDLEFNLSFNLMPSKVCSTETYLGLIMPIGNKFSGWYNQNISPYIFDPVISNVGNWGIQWGTTINIFLYNNDERNIRFIIGNNLLYFFPKDQYRTFDLLNRPWSRYLPVFVNYGTKNQLEQPLANFLTLNSRITSNFSTIVTTEIVYNKDILDMSIGYSFYARQSESVTIKETFPDLVLKAVPLLIEEKRFSKDDIKMNEKIKDYLLPPISIVRTVNLRLTGENISFYNNLLSEEVFLDPYKDLRFYNSIIRMADLDKSSATHPAVMAGTLYGKIAIKWDVAKQIGIGASYRLSHNNLAIEYANVWGWIEYSF
jgi:hypothetical protein